jgi:alkanesulfonate monooxygenase SsuD/methylene tetrahydromethanopterin reductase-like flavin-dependent oxidoreductase (luciferase family)
MRIGIKPGQIGLTTDELRRMWREAEDLGFESVWTFDHLTADLCYEAVTLLAAMAVLTSHVRIGCLVIANGTRQVESLAAQLGTVDALSDGRLEIGVGVSSQFARQDFDALNLPYGSWKQRFESFRRTVDRLQNLAGPDSPLGSRPVQSPVPIILGGKSQAVRDLAIERDLAWNHSGGEPDEFYNLRANQPDPQAQVFLRDVTSVERAVGEFQQAGASRLVFVMTPPYDPATLREVAREAGL